MRAPQQLRSKKRVEQVLSAAQSLILARGCAGLKMGDIAESAGVSVASIYQYFPNKQAIIAALSQRFLDAQILRVEQALAEPPANLDELLEIIGRVFNEVYELYRRDPVIRDIDAGYAADKQLRELDESAITQTVELIFERSKRLFRRGSRAQAKLALRLLLVFALSSIEMAVELDARRGRKLMQTANTMIDAAWEASIVPLAAPQS